MKSYSIYTFIGFLLLSIIIMRFIHITWLGSFSLLKSILYCFQICLYRPAPLSIEFSRQDTGVGCHFLLPGIFLTQWPNQRLLHLLLCHFVNSNSQSLLFLASKGDIIFGKDRWDYMHYTYSWLLSFKGKKQLCKSLKVNFLKKKKENYLENRISFLFS